MKMSNFAAGIAVCATMLLLAFSIPASADELQDINKLFKQGQHAQALERVNSYLTAKPKDAQARFLKGLILTEQNKTAEAIKVFTALSEDYPELPEPYNNLAVLYAAQGQYEKAKIALEMAIRTHPSYATAHENLGDIYAKMASQAYDKALQLDKSNTTAQTKLEMIKELFSSGSKGGVKPTAGKPVASGTLTASAAPKASTPAASPMSSTPQTVTPAPAPSAPQPQAKPAQPEAAPAKPASDKPAAEKAAANNDAEEVIYAVKEWGKAWSDKNVGTYLSFYAKDFKTPGGESREVWEKSRKDRITRPKSIAVNISNAKVKFADSTHASVSFRQIYRSDSLKSGTSKTLVMVKSNGKWLIQQEQVGR